MMYAFLHIPKTAGSSIRNMLSKSVKYFCHHKLSFLYESKRIISEDVIAFVRNPWDRLVSTYYFLKAGGANPKDERNFSKYINIDFVDFVMSLPDNPGLIEIDHLRPQTYYLDRPLQYIGRYEQIDFHWREVCRMIGQEYKPLPHSNTSRNPHYRDCYNEAMIRIVADVYAEDLKLFGYNY